jgi:hypothetical protein
MYNYEKFSAFDKALQSLGFTASTNKVYSSMVGSVHVYSRDHSALNHVRGKNELYDFMCSFKPGGSEVRVWIEDLPNLLLFLREIEAHEEPDEPDNKIADALLHIFNDNDVQAMIMRLSREN